MAHAFIPRVKCKPELVSLTIHPHHVPDHLMNSKSHCTIKPVTGDIYTPTSNQPTNQQANQTINQPTNQITNQMSSYFICIFKFNTLYKSSCGSLQKWNGTLHGAENCHTRHRKAKSWSFNIYDITSPAMHVRGHSYYMCGLNFPF